MTPAAPVALPPPTRFGPALAAVYAGQLARARTARAALLFVATLQSIGILLLLRGVVDAGQSATGRAVVAGSTVLVVAFVALNLLAQLLGAQRSAGALDHYATLPVPPAAVLLGIAAAYASFTVPGAALTALVGALIYGLPVAHLVVLTVVLPAAALPLAALGGLAGLLPRRPELATLAGQLGMTAALFLGVVPAERMPAAIRGVRAALPPSYAVDALAEALRASPDWSRVAADTAVAAAGGALLLAVAAGLFRRAVLR